MTDIKIDNPNWLLELAERMGGFQEAFDTCKAYMSDSVKSTLYHLQNRKNDIHQSIGQIESNIRSLRYSYNACVLTQTENSNCDSIYRQIGVEESRKSEYQRLLQRIIDLESHIISVYDYEVKPKEQKISQMVQNYPKAIQGLVQMEKLLQDYLRVSFGLSTTTLPSQSPKTSSPSNHSFQYINQPIQPQSIIESNENDNTTSVAENSSQMLSTQDLAKEYYKKSSRGQLVYKNMMEEKDVVINANDIILSENCDVKSQDFWNWHTRGKEDYLALVRDSQKLDEIFESDPIRVYKYKGKFVRPTDGRHRIAAAQELGINIKVKIVGEYFENND